MFIQSLGLQNLLSFGPDAEPTALGPLNVLIGPNGSGKSNFIEAIGLLHATPVDFAGALRKTGGVGAWLWKGEAESRAEVDAVLGYTPGQSLRHRLSFTEATQRVEIVDERIENAKASSANGKPYFYFGSENGRPMLNVHEQGKRALRREDINPEQSVLSQRKDPELYPELSFVADRYGAIRLYREWSFGRSSSPRKPQPADLPTAGLSDDAQNLGLILNGFRRDPPTKRALIDGLRQVFDGVQDFFVQIEGGMVQIFLEEEGWTLPATRLSDGTLRWLSLLAVLLDPKPPPLVCIEEPELGLHPDLMRSLARLLREASERTQLVVTTHSEALVDAFTDTPEVVLVCERTDGKTNLRRLDREGLTEWLQRYSLGELWMKGELGGTRW